MNANRRTFVTTTVLVVAAAAAVGGVSLASTAGSSPGYSGASSTTSAAGSPLTGRAGSAVRTAIATVQGTKERILVDAKGDPLYTYPPDTPTKSLVSGQLAALWPPLLAKAPGIPGTAGRLTTVNTTNGRQVAYNGHFLYTFVEDKPGHVTGQGVQDFFVATPDIMAASSRSSAPAGTSMGY